MKSMRWHVRLVVVLLALAILAIPSLAFAQDTSSAQAPLQPQFSVPGIFSLTLGNAVPADNNAMKFETATVDIPAINASAILKGLVLGPYMVPSGWDSLSLMQSKPIETANLSLAGTQLAVSGPSTGYSTDLYTTIDLHPSEALQVSGTIGVRYDGLAHALGVGVNEGNATIAAGPLTVALAGVNTGQGTLTADTASLASAQGTSIALSGLTAGPAGIGWDAMDVKLKPMSFGKVLTISPMQVRVGGAGQSYSTAAVMGIALNAGDAASVEGQLTMVRDGVTKETQFALQDGTAKVAIPGFSVGIEGIDTMDGMNFDSITIDVERAGLSAEMTNVVMNPTTGFAFDTATIQMQPSTGGQGGFQMQLTRTPDGYLMTTTSMIPTASK